MRIEDKIVGLAIDLFGESKEEVKRNNRNARELISIFEDLRKDEEKAVCIYSSLLEHYNNKVKYEAAVSCLKLKKNVKQAKKALKEIVADRTNPEISFCAEMVLETWRKKGEIN